MKIFPVPGIHRYPNFFLAGTAVLIGTQLLKFSRYPVPSGTQIFKISMGTGRYPGTHGYRGTARADPWSGPESDVLTKMSGPFSRGLILTAQKYETW